MKTWLATGLLCAFCTSALLAQTATPNSANRPTLRAAKTVPGTQDRLSKRIPEVSFTDLPFDQVVDWLAQHTGMQIHVRWQKIVDAGIARDKAITLNVKNLRFAQVLWMVMNEAGEQDIKLAYRAAGNLMVLSTADDLGQEMLVKVYDVSDLLVRVRNFTNAPQVDIGSQQGGGGGGGGAGGGNQNVFGGAGGGGSQDEEDDEDQNQQGGEIDPELTRLIEIIQTTVEPQTWELSNGPGTIRAFRRQLIVRNNIHVHQLLDKAIEEGP